MLNISSNLFLHIAMYIRVKHIFEEENKKMQIEDLIFFYSNVSLQLIVRKWWIQKIKKCMDGISAFRQQNFHFMLTRNFLNFSLSIDKVVIWNCQKHKFCKVTYQAQLFKIFFFFFFSFLMLSTFLVFHNFSLRSKSNRLYANQRCAYQL